MLQNVIVILGMDKLILHSGRYTFASTNANGCDSTATLNLTINPSTTSSADVTECDSYSWNGLLILQVEFTLLQVQMLMDVILQRH